MKKLVTSYTFNAASKTVTATDFTTLENILMITNVTTNTIIYNFANSSLGGTLASTVLTLAYNTTSMSNTDKLQIFVDDGLTTRTVSGTVTANLAAGTNAVGKLAANDGVDIGDVTINNASGASAVNVQDGGNSLTIDQATASNLNAQVVGTVADQAADSGNPVKAGGKYNATQPTYTDGQRGDLQINSRGELRVALTNAGTSPAVNTSYADAGSNTANSLSTKNYNLVFNGTTWDRMRGDTTGNYVVGNVAAAATDSGNPVKIGGKYNATLPTYTDGQRGDAQIGSRGSLSVTLMAKDATDAVGTGTSNADAVAADGSPVILKTRSYPVVYNGTSFDRARSGSVTGSTLVAPVGTTSNGATPYSYLSAASTNATNIKSSAGQIYNLEVFNTSASAKYVKIYDKATAPTLASDTPKKRFLIPAGGGFTESYPVGEAYANGISFAITGGVADTDTTATAANDVLLNMGYK